MILAIILVVVALILLGTFFFTTDGKSGKKVIMLSVATGVLLSGMSLLAKTDISLMAAFFSIVAFSIIVGSIFMKTFLRLHKSVGSWKHYHYYLIYCSILLIAYGVGTYLFNTWHVIPVGAILGIALAAFALPILFISAFTAYDQIPTLIYPAWYFPEYSDYDFDSVDTSELLLINLSLQKSAGDKEETPPFKVKSPMSIEFKYFFIKFINDYNRKYPEYPIDPWNYDGAPIGWRFYVKPGLLDDKVYLDPDETIKSSKIKEKNIIIVERIFADPTYVSARV